MRATILCLCGKPWIHIKEDAKHLSPLLLFLYPPHAVKSSLDSHTNASIEVEAFPLGHTVQGLPALVHLLQAVLICSGWFFGEKLACTSFIPRHHCHLVVRCGESIVVLGRSFEGGPWNSC